MVKGARTRRTAFAARAARFGMCAVLCMSALSCGGGGRSTSLSSGGNSGGSTSPVSNQVSVVVDAGPTSTSPDFNTLFTTVTVCVPGTTNCQAIDHIQVDTMSYGLRLLASALTLNLPVQTIGSQSLVECTAFVSTYSWGPVALVDIQIGGESASSVPVQVIGDPNFVNIPTDCSSVGMEQDTVASFGANGVLGIGVFAQDCGPNCVSTVDNAVYYACAPSAPCQPTAVASVAKEVTNPIASFATDNNGVIIQLPGVAAQGAATVTGSMIFGIDTQANNKSGSQTVLAVEPSGANSGDFMTIFNGQSLVASFLDTGSNGLYFSSSLTKCTESGLTEFYCPAGTQTLTAQLQGQSNGLAVGASVTVTFNVGVADALFQNGPTFTAFPTVAGTFSGTSSDTFDWGLPFYYGRTVYTAMENASTSVGTGPYVAF